MSDATAMVTRVDFVAVPTHDLPKAVEFYGETLGLERSVYLEERNYAEFETGNLTLSVIDAEKMGLEHVPMRSGIALHVEDVASARSDARRARRQLCPEHVRHGRLPHGDLRRPRRKPLDPAQPLRAAPTAVLIRPPHCSICGPTQVARRKRRRTDDSSPRALTEPNGRSVRPIAQDAGLLTRATVTSLRAWQRDALRAARTVGEDGPFLVSAAPGRARLARRWSSHGGMLTAARQAAWWCYARRRR